ncbi:uncharacterized protein LOC131008742 [Salvia miltiorrhiza]|uniref:uncharacterized protein LOC131008742 n=1 Tax=Salvia miltiorrhiza TaxID=226208 RepID=UPI0025ABE2D7|nr:uncharacterized protein LOC131008742 [Salvia miltiorrhiza]XP_057791758.1 uncharacterized protein LOC131008742 [Salvia miltiorrhiza]
MAENRSKDLLELEAKPGAVSSASNLESKLFVCKKDVPFSPSDASRQKPTMAPLPKSQFLGKVKDFLGVLSESNKKLMEDAKERPDSYDIEVISGDESKYIEMDLMLGIADLHTPEAVAAAESAMAGYRPPVRMAESSSRSEDEDSSDDEDDAEEDGNHEQDTEAGSESVKLGLKVGDSLCQESKKQKPKKRPKIVELA